MGTGNNFMWYGVPWVGDGTRSRWMHPSNNPLTLIDGGEGGKPGRAVLGG